MAVLKSKQLNPNLTGSFVLSGSSQTLHGTTTIHGTTTVSGSLTLKGSSVDLNIRQDDNTNIARLLTTPGGESSLKLYDNANHGSALETDSGGSSALLLYDNKYHSAGNTVDINSADSTALVIKSGSSTIFTVDRDNTLISGSSTSTGSFGRVETSGDIAASGNISSSANITGNILNVKTRVKAIGSSLEFAGNTLDFVDGGSVSYLFRGISSGAFEAYHAGNKKLETTSGGIYVNGNISGSATSTGSFGHLSIQGNVTASGIIRADAFESATGGDTISFGDNLSVTGHITSSGNINTTSGRVFEQGTSVIDHATAMAIVFGG